MVTTVVHIQICLALPNPTKLRVNHGNYILTYTDKPCPTKLRVCQGNYIRVQGNWKCFAHSAEVEHRRGTPTWKAELKLQNPRSRVCIILQAVWKIFLGNPPADVHNIFHHIISYHIISYHILSYLILSYLVFISRDEGAAGIKWPGRESLGWCQDVWISGTVSVQPFTASWRVP